jgi:predicted DNA-binding protein
MQVRPELKNLAVRLHPELYQRLRLVAFQRHATLQSAVLEAIELWLERQQEDEQADRRRRIGAIKGMFAGSEPGRVLSEELSAERRREAQRE